MKINFPRLAAISCATIIAVGASNPALAIESTTDSPVSQISESQFENNLSPNDLEKWDALSQDQRRDALAAMSDPRFGDPGQVASLNNDYKNADVAMRHEEERPLGTAIQTVSPTLVTGSRTSYLKDSFKVVGITVASVTTNARYNYSGSRVTGVSYCGGSYQNLIPGRQLTSYNYHSLSSGNLTCKVDWNMTTLWGAGGSRSATQGFRVNGNGTFLAKWHV